MKTDAQLREDVMAEIKWAPSFTASAIEVSAASGVVTLNGTVAAYAEKWALERAAQRVDGVKAVAEEIQVKPEGTRAKTDAEIAAIAVMALKANVWAPTGIQVTVRNGWLTLRGVVNWELQKRVATESVRNLAGVKGFSNNITLKPTAQSSPVEDALENEQELNAELDAGTIKIAADGGMVTLSGRFRS